MRNRQSATPFEGRNQFGIYIQTYPGDIHLASVLVHSIRAVSPDLPIMIIPGDDFDFANSPFDVPIMSAPDGFWAKLEHKDRSFWAFEGPFATFLFLDADILCVKSLDGIARRAIEQRGDFMFVLPWEDETRWRAIAGNPSHPEHDAHREVVRRNVGSGPLDQFDPDYDSLALPPFNTGTFVSRRSVIREHDLAALHKAERTFYRDVLHKEWSWAAKDLFFYDQGRMNYLAAKLSIPLYPLEPDLICRPGASAVRVSHADVASDRCDFHIIHWMGSKSPSPSLFSAGSLFRIYASLWTAVGRRTGRHAATEYARLPECTGYSLWRYYREHCIGPISFGEKLRWSWRDLKKAAKLWVRWLRLLVSAE